jgi:hypothetical protein
MTYPDGPTPRLLIFLLIVFVAGQIVAWRVFRRRKPTFTSTLRWSFVAGLCGFLTMLVLVFATVFLGLWGHPVDLGV